MEPTIGRILIEHIKRENDHGQLQHQQIRRDDGKILIILGR